jgi:cytoskeletal protein RodZ
MRPSSVRLFGALAAIVLAIGLVAVLRHGSSDGQRVAVATHDAATTTSSSSSSATTSSTTVTTTAVTEAPSSTEAPTTTRLPEPPTTAPTVVETTTTLDAAAATLSLRNDYDSTVRIDVSDVTSGSWTLAPGESAGPWILETASDHGDGASVTRLDDKCGSGDGQDYFKAGHAYLLVVTTSTNPNRICSDGPIGPDLTVYDLTDGTTVVI